MMSFDEFAVAIKDSVASYISGDVTLDIRDVTKNNGVIKKGLTLRKVDENVYPTVYLEEMYNDFCDDAISIDDLALQIVNTYEEIGGVGVEELNADKYLSLEYVKENVVYCLVNKDRNAELLEIAPHREYMDLTLVYRVIMPMSDTGAFMSILVKDEHLKLWNADEDMLFEWAKSNTERLLPSQTMTIGEMARKNHILSLMGIDPDDDFMLIVTNEQGINGAGVMLYADELRKISDRLNSDIYILPSSIHELIVIRAGEDNSSELLDMVKSVNVGILDPTDILSDSVYRYNRTGELKKVA